MPDSENSNNITKNSIAHVLLASLIGTTIEFFDFYVFATAAALIFPVIFFPKGDPSVALLSSFAVFAAAFFARPLGSIIFGHFGDKIGRKATLVAALLTMGISTILIGFLPTYATIGWLAPLLLTLCRFGQGIGLGGEWGGAVLLATENAPPKKRGWYAMFPQLGAPIGLILSSGTFWLMWNFLNESQRMSWGWRIPFIASLILIAVGLWVRLSIKETPEFQKTIDRQERVKVPMIEVFFKYPRALFLGTFAGMTTFVLFYLFSAYLLSYSTNHLSLSFNKALEVQMLGAVFFALLIPFAGKISDRIGRRLLMIWVTIFIGAFSFAVPYFLDRGLLGVFTLSVVGLGLMGLTYGPIGAALASPFPTAIRYSGASMTFNLAGIVGASFAPYIAETLVQNFGTAYIGYYLLLSAFISLTCFIGFTDKEISA
ncbi:MFS transporter [Bartonella tamiae]|uniref:MFS transporter, metabolite:H+ symporter (MHS) family protein n=1 Tax=Bartonella tamiae Th239 TaxID=1094558 RepID=J0R4T3_9HYPH|nr:MFS transporter [Bartonella tamiae]EJF90679.1 MFS transporter, metabolite:H+ symporter (MHS) family protein [Bartonella tamiae Th239]EJF93944.1 MFS transporter, metabolite:H+ symporter (MHS) family protein [Bartonella tamiae Th307]